MPSNFIVATVWGPVFILVHIVIMTFAHVDVIQYAVTVRVGVNFIAATVCDSVFVLVDVVVMTFTRVEIIGDAVSVGVWAGCVMDDLVVSPSNRSKTRPWAYVGGSVDGDANVLCVEKQWVKRRGVGIRQVPDGKEEPQPLA